MKQALHIFILITATLTSACSKDDFSYFQNPHIAQEYGEIRILAIGNSFSDDSMEYIPEILDNLGIENVELARLYVSGCTLERHIQLYNKKEAAYKFYHSKAGKNHWIKIEQKASLQDALDMGEWDIITIQQASGLSGIYNSYTPHLKSLINIIREAQPQAEIVWHMTWAYSTESPHSEYPKYDYNQQKMYQAITECAQHLLNDYKVIKRVIPSGTTIQSLRTSIINNPPKDFTRDGSHIDLGAGRYALACTWYEVLIYPYTNISMMGNSVRLDVGDIKVDDTVASYCQKAAKLASEYPFKVQTLE